MAGRKRRAEGDPAIPLHHPAKVQQMKSSTSEVDKKRAHECMQFVGALNSQFTSWVEKQQRDYPYQLWQEGVEDYLNHASKILADFKDVVEWCKTSGNSNTHQEGLTNSETDVGKTGETAVKAAEDVNNGSKLWVSLPLSSTTATAMPTPTTTTTTTQTTTTATTTLFSLPPLQFSQPGSEQRAGTEKQNEEDGEAVDEPSSPSVRRTEDPGSKIVLESKCKLYTKGEAGSDKAWVDKGFGQLQLKCKEGAAQGTKEAKATILFRNNVGKLLLNALLYPNIKMNVQKNTVTGIFHSAETDVKDGSNEENVQSKPRMYLLKMKTGEEADKVAKDIMSNAPA